MRPYSSSPDSTTATEPYGLAVGPTGEVFIDLRPAEARSHDTERFVPNGKNLTAVQPMIDTPTTVRLYRRFAKRIIDVVLATTFLVLLSPVILFLAIALHLSFHGGVLFRQERIGRFGRSFFCYKFRTMRHDRRVATTPFNGEDRRSSHKRTDDPRHTRIGKILRRFSLDELPQLLNVLKGDMSIVGPRPEMTLNASTSFVRHPRHLVRPGLTGPFQVSPLRGNGNLSTGLDLDYHYVAHAGLTTDVALMLRTVFPVVRGTGS